MLLIVIAQAFLLPLVGFGMYRLWKRVASTGKWIGLLVSAGFLCRVILGLALFWASFLPLPFPAGSEDDNGFWFYAWDGRTYFRSASTAALGGPAGILAYPATMPSPVFVKVLATFVYVLGSVAGVGLLVNLLAYLGTCAALLSLCPRETPTTIGALGALSLSPSLILWSLQPLKDIFFLFLITAFVALAFAWHSLWKRTRERPVALRRVATGVGLMAVMYTIAGIRWYFALLLVVASLLFFVLSSLRRRPWMPALASAMVFLGLVYAFLAGAGPYVPISFRDNPVAVLSRIGALSASVGTRLVSIREGYARTAANTAIGAAEAPAPMKTAPSPGSSPVATLKSEPIAPSPTPPASPRRQPAKPLVVADSAREADSPKSEVAAVSEPVSAQLPGPVEVAKIDPPGVVESAPAQTPASTSTSAAPAPPVTPEAAVSVQIVPPPVTQQEATPGTAIVAARTATGEPGGSLPDPGSVPNREAASNPSAPDNLAAPSVAVKPQSRRIATPRVPRRKLVAKVPAVNAAPVPVSVTLQPVSVAAAPAIDHVVPGATAPNLPTAARAASNEEGGESSDFGAGTRISRSPHFSKLMMGAAAMALPRFVGETLGLFRVEGGGTMWLFAELDTLYFDAVLIFAAVVLFSGVRRGYWRHPALALVVTTTAVIAAMLAYTITNFGTLFRHRGMVFIGLLIIPLIVAAERARRGTPAEPLMSDLDRSPGAGAAGTQDDRT